MSTESQAQPDVRVLLPNNNVSQRAQKNACCVHGWPAHLFCCCTTQVLDSIPDLDMLAHLPSLLEGLMGMLSDPNREIRAQAHKALLVCVRVCDCALGGRIALRSCTCDSAPGCLLPCLNIVCK